MEMKENMPSHVYKYRRWDNNFHKHILENSELFFSDPRDFDDPLDCNPPIDYPKGHDLFIYILNYSFLHNNYNYVEHVIFASNMYKRSPLAFPDELKKVKEKMDNDFNNHFGVLSLTEDCFNDYMWHEYSNNHEGFCVGFDTQILFDSFKGGCGSVLYKDPLPTIDFAKDSLDVKIFKTVYCKEKKWENEKEFRFHKYWLSEEIVNRNCKFPTNAIVEIIIGKNMSCKYKDDLVNIVKYKYPLAVLREENGNKI